MQYKVGDEIYLTDDVERRFKGKVVKVDSEAIWVKLPEEKQPLEIARNALDLIQPAEKVG